MNLDELRASRTASVTVAETASLFGVDARSGSALLHADSERDGATSCALRMTSP